MSIELLNETSTLANAQILPVFTFSGTVKEGETSSYSVQLRGPGGSVQANTEFSAITLSLIDEVTRTPVNSRLDQDVLGVGKLGQNDVAFSATALFTWNLTSLDSVLADPTQTLLLEWHRAIITFSFDFGSGPEVAVHEIRIPVRRAFSTSLPTVSQW